MHVRTRFFVTYLGTNRTDDLLAEQAALDHDIEIPAEVREQCYGLEIKRCRVLMDGDSACGHPSTKVIQRILFVERDPESDRLRRVCQAGTELRTRTGKWVLADSTDEIIRLEPSVVEVGGE